MFLLFYSWVWYAVWDTHFSDNPLRETYMEPLFTFLWVGHCWLFPTQCDLSCPPTSLVLPSSSSRISAAVLICLWPITPHSFFSLQIVFFYPLSFFRYFLTDCVKFTLLLVSLGEIFMPFPQLNLWLYLSSTGWYATTDPVPDTTWHTRFLCWTLLWRRRIRRSCFYS